jgi:hypothetical protein
MQAEHFDVGWQGMHEPLPHPLQLTMSPHVIHPYLRQWLHLPLVAPTPDRWRFEALKEHSTLRTRMQSACVCGQGDALVLSMVQTRLFLRAHSMLRV